MTHRIVAISQRRDPTGPPHNEIRDALDHRLAAFVAAAGGVPVPVPSAAVSNMETGAWLAAIRPDAVLLPGGRDIGADPVRDVMDRMLLDHARSAGLPLLGLCRGMQSMADEAGARLRDVEGHVATRHRLEGEIARVVNSYHNRALADLPDGFHALARAPDGVVEAIAHDTLRWEGWMWHPEREERFAAQDVSRLKDLLT